MNLMDNFTEEFLIKVYSLKDGSLLNEINLEMIKSDKWKIINFSYSMDNWKYWI